MADGPKNVGPYDPKRGFIAQGVPENPIGTVDELEALRMPVDVFPSCAPESIHRGVKGCPCEHLCTMDYKGKSFAEGGGPRNHGWENIKSAGQGGNVVRGMHPCFWGVAQQESMKENGSILRPIADEGEEIEILTGTLSPIPSDPFHREDKLVKLKIEPFKRPGENQKIAQNLLRATIAKDEEARLANERTGELLGVPGATTPLNLRRRGGRG